MSCKKCDATQTSLIQNLSSIPSNPLFWPYISINTVKNHFCNIFMFFKRFCNLFFWAGGPERPLWFPARAMLCQYNNPGKHFGQPSSACCRKPPNKMGNGWKTAFLKVETSHLSSEGALTTTSIKLLSLLHRSSLPVTPNAEKELWLTGQWLTTKQACNIPGWDFPKHLKELGTEGPLKVLSPWPLRQSRKSHPKSWPIQFSQRNHDPGNGKTDSWWWWWCVQLY